jgi:predicted dehydrogenase
VGVIRCDTHAFWYAHFFDTPDPPGMRAGHRCNHYYFYRCDDPATPRFEPVPGMRISRVYDEQDIGAAERLRGALGGRPKVCQSLEEVSDGVDLVYLANCNTDGEDHLRYATPALRKGVPLFLDMPFAYTLAEAREILALANRHDSVVMCGFMLGQSPHFRRFRARFADIAPVRRLVVPNHGPILENLTAALTITQLILGDGCEWVQSSGDTPHDLVRLHYDRPDGGTEAIVANARHPARGQRMTSTNYHHCGWTASAYGDGGAVHSPRVDDYSFTYGGDRMARMAKYMALTRKAPILRESMLELMKMVEATRQSHATGRPVALADVP